MRLGLCCRLPCPVHRASMRTGSQFPVARSRLESSFLKPESRGLKAFLFSRPLRSGPQRSQGKNRTKDRGSIVLGTLFPSVTYFIVYRRKVQGTRQTVQGLRRKVQENRRGQPLTFGGRGSGFQCCNLPQFFRKDRRGS